MATELTPLSQEFDSAFRRNFSRVLEPDQLIAFRRFISKGRRNGTFSLSVGLSAVQLVPFDANRIELIIYNLGAATIYVGTPRKVTTGPIGDPNAGMPIASNTGMILDNNVGELWAISGSAAQDVRVWDVAGEAP